MHTQLPPFSDIDKSPTIASTSTSSEPAPQPAEHFVSVIYPSRASSERVRSTEACDFCRRRRTKCSGQKPTCDRCSQRGEECTWTPGLRITRAIHRNPERHSFGPALTSSETQYPTMRGLFSHNIASALLPPSYASHQTSSSSLTENQADLSSLLRSSSLRALQCRTPSRYSPYSYPEHSRLMSKASLPAILAEEIQHPTPRHVSGSRPTFMPHTVATPMPSSQSRSEPASSRVTGPQIVERRSRRSGLDHSTTSTSSFPAPRVLMSLGIVMIAGMARKVRGSDRTPVPAHLVDAVAWLAQLSPEVEKDDAMSTQAMASRSISLSSEESVDSRRSA